MLKIQNIRAGSIAEELGIAPGSVLLEINGVRIRDALDYTYQSADEYLELLIESPDGEQSLYEIERDFDADLGLDFTQDRIRVCGNKCVFCFIDQLPSGLRHSLYLKDEDYRLSFLDGNFITLTAVTENDLKRIIEYHLSPLYVSVHSTNEELRRTMLGRRKIKPVMPILKRLAEAEIEIHTQIVLCPGYNDGAELEKTVSDLAALRPFVKSLGIVPVGLSRHRDGQPKIESVNRGESAKLLEDYGTEAQSCFRKSGEDGFVYLADEFFLLAGLPIPSADYYDDYPQWENGIGMVRSFLDEFEQNKSRLTEISDRRKKCITLISGKLMAPLLAENLLPEVGRLQKDLSLSVLPVANHLLGESITVSGLLSGKDIIREYSGRGLKSDLIILPPNCINTDGILLDDHSPASIAKSLGTDVVVGEYDIVNALLQANAEIESKE